MVQGLRLVLFGPPGAGKGTQAQLLTQQLNLAQISSGDLFRHHLGAGTPLGLRAAEYMNQGLLVPDEVTIDIILEKVLSLESREGFILDGFPRNRNQAEALEEALDRRSRGLDKVVSMDVPEEELVSRLAGRFVCRECQAPYTITPAHEAAGPDGQAPKCERCGGELYQRADDHPDAVKKRIEVYYSETFPVLDFYRERGLLVEIPGVDTVDKINRHIMVELGEEAGANSGQ